MSLSQEIESRINIVDLVSRYVPLKKSGANYKALSPFTSEKSPSFVVSPAKNLAYCFSTHRGGGPIRFLMEIEGLEFREALKILAKEAWIELTSSEFKRSSEEADVYRLYKSAAEFYHRALFDTENIDKLAYLQNRGLSQETIEKFQLGYSGEPRALMEHLKSIGATEQQVIDSGLFVSAYRDKFFGRITFPIANFLGHTVAFTARIIDQGEPKYLNSPASAIFDKSKTLYGFHLAKTEIARKKCAIVVEGQMDTVALHQAGVTNTVGISGSALTKDHIKLLKRSCEKVYLCLDTDKAGTTATFASIENLLNEDLDIRIIRMTTAKDPDEYLKAGGNWEELLNNSLSPIGFYLAAWSLKYDLTSAVGKKQLVEEIFVLLDHVTSQIEVDAHLREIARSLDIGYQTIFDEYKSRRKKAPIIKRDEPGEKKEFSNSDLLAAYLLEFDLFDLFFARFGYTVADLDFDPSFLLLKNVLTDTKDVTKREDIDGDFLQALRLSVENKESDSTPEKIQSEMLGLLKRLHYDLYQREETARLSGIDPNSAEYLTIKSDLFARKSQLDIRNIRPLF